MTKRGYTIAELLAVTSLIALAAYLITPNIAVQDDARTEHAAAAVASALSFARDESLQTSVPHRLALSAEGMINVYVMSDEAIPLPLQLATNPVNRQPYAVDLRKLVATNSLVSTARFATDDGQIRNQILFDARGIPKHIDASGHALLTGGDVALSIGNTQFRVSLDPRSGRVSKLRL